MARWFIFGGQSMTKELFSMLLSKDDEIRKLQHDYSGNFWRTKASDLRKLLPIGLDLTKLLSNSWAWNTCKTLEGERTIAPNVLTFQYEGENERLRSSGQWGTLKSYSPLTAKSIISSITEPPHLKKHTPKIQATVTKRMEYRNGFNLCVRRNQEENSGQIR